MFFLHSSGKWLLILFVFGVVCWEIHRLRLAMASSGWRATAGNVHDAFVEERRDAGDSPSYLSKVRYAYTVRSVSFEATRISYRFMLSDGRAEAHEQLHGIFSGRPVIVYYDPRKPSRSVLIRGYSWVNLVGVSLLLMFLAFLIFH